MEDRSSCPSTSCSTSPSRGFSAARYIEPSKVWTESTARTHRKPLPYQPAPSIATTNARATSAGAMALSGEPLAGGSIIEVIVPPFFNTNYQGAVTSVSAPLDNVGGSVVLMTDQGKRVVSITSALPLTAPADQSIPTCSAAVDIVEETVSAEAPLVAELAGIRLVNDSGATITSISTDPLLKSSSTSIPTEAAIKEYVDTSLAPSTIQSVSAPLVVEQGDLRIVNADGATVSAVSTDHTMATATDEDVSTSLATKTYVDNSIAASLYITSVSKPLEVLGNNLHLTNEYQEEVTLISADGTFSSNSNTYVPTERAVKTYVDTTQFITGALAPLYVNTKFLSLINDLGASINTITTDGGLNTNSDLVIPSERAVRTYVGSANYVNAANAPLSISGRTLSLLNNLGSAIVSITTDGTLVDDSDLIIPSEKAIKTYVDTTQFITGALFPLYVNAKFLSLVNDLGDSLNAISTDGTLANNSDLLVPTEKAIRTYVTGEVKVKTVSAPLALTGTNLAMVNNNAGTITTISADAGLLPSTDLVIPTQLAVKSYVDSAITAAGVTYVLPLYRTGSSIYVTNAGAGASGVITTGTQTIAGEKTFSSVLRASGSVGSSSPITGSLVVTGGLGVTADLHMGGVLGLDGIGGANIYASQSSLAIYSAGPLFSSEASSLIEVKTAYNGGELNLCAASLSNVRLITGNSNASMTVSISAGPTSTTAYKPLNMSNTTEATSYSTGSITSTGGLAVAKSIYAGTKVQTPLLSLDNGGVVTNTISSTIDGQILASVPQTRWQSLYHLMVPGSPDGVQLENVGPGPWEVWSFAKDKTRSLVGVLSSCSPLLAGSSVTFKMRLCGIEANKPSAIARFVVSMWSTAVGGLLYNPAASPWATTLEIPISATQWQVSEYTFAAAPVPAAGSTILIALLRYPTDANDLYDGKIGLVDFGLNYQSTDILAQQVY